ncbi:MAG: hypothetical protein AAGB14_03530 [Verrucomicrobiota bacterium]
MSEPDPSAPDSSKKKPLFILGVKPDEDREEFKKRVKERLSRDPRFKNFQKKEPGADPSNSEPQ